MPWSDVLEIGVHLLDGLVTWATVGTGSRRKHAEARAFAKSSTSLRRGWSLPKCDQHQLHFTSGGARWPEETPP